MIFNASVGVVVLAVVADKWVAVSHRRATLCTVRRTIAAANGQERPQRASGEPETVDQCDSRPPDHGANRTVYRAGPLAAASRPTSCERRAPDLRIKKMHQDYSPKK